MRSYQCHYYVKRNKKLVKNSNEACWAGLYTFLGNKKIKCIYISDFKFEETEPHRKLLLKTINKITPCIELKSGYIRYKLIRGVKNEYDKNLILLNFIRNLWSKHVVNWENFFISLNENKDIEDPIQLLSTANKAVIFKGSLYYKNPGHSNVIKDSKVKLLSDFIEYSDNSTTKFFL